MIKWIVKRVLMNPVFITLIVELIVAVSDRQITDDEKDQLWKRAVELVSNLVE